MLRLLVLLIISTCTRLVIGEETVHQYPVFTSCNSTLIDIIKEYWKSNEMPTNIQKRMEDEGRYIDFHSSYEGLSDHFKCNSFDAADHYFNVTFQLKNEGAPIIYRYEVTDSGKGYLTAKPVSPFDDPQHRFTWYVIHLEKGLELSYVCNDDHARPTTPLADVLVAPGSFNDKALMAKAQEYKALLESWGFKFTFKSFPECFGEDTE